MNDTPRKYPYPFIECDEHEGPQQCVLICPCLFEGMEKPEGPLPKLFRLPTPDDIGLLLCEACDAAPAETVRSNLRAMCKTHFLNRMRRAVGAVVYCMTSEERAAWARAARQ